jgi:hypothetical protein
VIAVRLEREKRRPVFLAISKCSNLEQNCDFVLQECEHIRKLTTVSLLISRYYVENTLKMCVKYKR